MRLTLKSYRGLRIRLFIPPLVDKHQLLHGEYQPLAPLEATIDQESRIFDIIETGSANLYAISDRFRQVLSQLRLTGWAALPVNVRRGQLGVPLWLLAATGRCGPVYGSDGVPRPGLDRLGQYLDPLEWDGSDILCPENRTAVFVTGPAAELLLAAKLTNLHFELGGFEPTPA